MLVEINFSSNIYTISCVCSNIAALGNGPNLFSKLVYLFLVTKYASAYNASMIWEKEQEALGNLFPVDKD